MSKKPDIPPIPDVTLTADVESRQSGKEDSITEIPGVDHDRRESSSSSDRKREATLDSLPLGTPPVAPPPDSDQDRSTPHRCSSTIAPELLYRDPHRYDVMEEHGRGGIGRVLRVRDKDLDRIVALKELQRNSRVAEARFIREALITAKLQHPGIVPIHEAGRWPDGRPFYSMKLVEGRSLKQKIADCTNMEQRLSLLPNLLSVADAVAYAHSQGVIHRDLKPSNVVVGAYGETVVIDWGLAKRIDEPSEAQSSNKHPYRSTGSDGLTVAGSVIGTPGYMAPEQARGEPADERSDVFALGAILREILLHPHAAHLRKNERTIPKELFAICRRASANDRDARYDSALSFARDLRSFLEGGLVGAHRYTLPHLARRWIRQHRSAAAISALSVGTIAVLVAVGVVRIERQRDLASGARLEAESALATVSADRNRLILLQGENALRSDPTQTLAWLKTYQGADQRRARQLAAIAVELGVSKLVIENSDGALHRAVASADGTRMVAATTSGRLLSWSPSTMKEQPIASLRGGLAFDLSRDGRLAFETPARGVVLLERSGRERVLVASGPAPVRDLRFSHSSEVLAIADAAGLVRAHVLNTNSTRDLALGSEVSRVGISSDGQWIFGCSASGVLFAWRHSDDEIRRSTCTGEQVASSGRTAVAATATGFAVFQLGNWKRFDAPFKVERVLVEDTLGYLVVAAPTGALALAELDDLPTLRWQAIGLPNPSIIAVDPATSTIAVGNQEGGIALHDPISGRVRAILRGHAGRVQSLSVLTSGSLVSASVDGQLRIWQRRHFSDIRAQVDDSIFHARFSPDGRTIAMDSRLGDVRLADEDAFARVIGRHSAAVFGLDWSPHGHSFATASWDGTVRVWSRNGDGVATFRGHSGIVRTVRFHGDTILSAGEDGRVLSWTIGHGAPKTIARHAGPVRRIVVSELGTIASIGEDGSLILSQPDSDETIVALTDTPGLSEAVFSTDGRQLFVAADDGQVRHWKFPFNDAHSTFAHRSSPASSIDWAAGVLAIGWADGLVTLTSEGRTESLDIADGRILTLKLDSAGNYLAVSARGAPIHVEHLPSRRIAQLRGHDDDVGHLEFSVHGRLVSTSYDGTVMDTAVDTLNWVPTGLPRWLEHTTNLIVSSTIEHPHNDEGL